MRYNSIGEYFYRLSNRCLVLALLPVAFVWVAYLINHYFFSGLPFILPDNQGTVNIIIGLGIVVILIFWTQFYLVRRRLRGLRQEPSLGVRIKLYIPIVLIRFRSFSVMIFLIGLGVFLTARLVLLYLLPIPILLFLIFWPARWRVASDMKLKPVEKEVLKNNSLGV